MSNAVAQQQLRTGVRYFSRTAHPRFGQHRQTSPLWVGTTNNLTFNELKGVYSTNSRWAREHAGSEGQQALAGLARGLGGGGLAWLWHVSIAEGERRVGARVRRITGEFKDSREKQKLRICYSHEFVGNDEDHAVYRLRAPALPL